MKIITKPTVVLVGHSKFIEHPEYKIPWDGDSYTKLGAFCAKGCYDSYGPQGRSNEANQKAILEHRHGSVAEHISFSLCIEGITRGLSLELNRHRHFAISQRSTRYTEEDDAAIVLEPYYARLYEVRGRLRQESTDLLIDSHIEAAEASFAQYKREVEQLMAMNPLSLEGFALRKWARGKARNILPHNLETRGVWTGNVRAWRWFLESRSSVHAEEEIRRLTIYVLDVLRETAPVYFEDMEINSESEIVTPYSKI